MGTLRIFQFCSPDRETSCACSFSRTCAACRKNAKLKELMTVPLFFPSLYFIFCPTLCIAAHPPDQSVKWRELHVLLARYATYLGLCVATFIIFKRNVYTASVIGVFVAVYIGFSEYTLTNWKEHSVTTTFKNALSW